MFKKLKKTLAPKAKLEKLNKDELKNVIGGGGATTTTSSTATSQYDLGSGQLTGKRQH